MVKCFLQRVKSGDSGTFGILYIPSAMKMWYTIEQPWRDNKPNISCISAGTYDATMQHSPRFSKSLYRLNDKQTSPRSAILLHAANWAGDRVLGLKSDLEGCIALGMAYSDNLSGQPAILSSKQAFNEFYEVTKGDPIQLTIVDVIV